MKRILVVSFISVLFILFYPVDKEEIIVKINKCGFNLFENNSIIAEYDNKCLRVIRKKKEEKNLMIVAHPDDESIWGGGHLLNDNYLVVCITCGNVSYRDEEFRKVMEKTGDEYIFLGYPDLTNGYIDRWDTSYESIKQDLKNIIDSKNWKTIVTHNPEGEYGHIQHKMSSQITTELSDKSKLYYFGRYYAKDSIPNMPSLDSDLYDRKMNDIISIYVSQPLAMSRHNHMMSYENFVAYNEW